MTSSIWTWIWTCCGTSALMQFSLGETRFVAGRHGGCIRLPSCGRRAPAAPRMIDPAAPFALGDGPDACLLLHGLTGAPSEVRPIGEALAKAGMRAVGPLLPGHGTTPRALHHVGRRDVEAAV